MKRWTLLAGFFLLFAVVFAWHAGGGLGAGRGGGAACPSGDVNADGSLDISDAVYILEFLFTSGEPPVPCQAQTAADAREVTFDPAGSSLGSRTVAAALLELDRKVESILAINSSLTSRVEALEGTVGIELVDIPAGSFIMGSPDTEKNRNPNESLHAVTLTRPFKMGATEVTQAQFETVMGWNPSVFANCPDCPVEHVNWYDARTFCQKLTVRHILEGKIGERDFYRLPTETEWEYACRAGTNTRFSFGDSLECGEAESFCASASPHLWWSGNNSEQAYGPKPVRQKSPNPWGLYDMHGNVMEWCEDRFGAYPQGEVTDPKGPQQGIQRVLRGGFWSQSISGCRSAQRNAELPQQRDYGYSGPWGFRVVLEERE